MYTQLARARAAVRAFIECVRCLMNFINTCRFDIGAHSERAISALIFATYLHCALEFYVEMTFRSALPAAIS